MRWNVRQVDNWLLLDSATPTLFTHDPRGGRGIDGRRLFEEAAAGLTELP